MRHFSVVVMGSVAGGALIGVLLLRGEPSVSAGAAGSSGSRAASAMSGVTARAVEVTGAPAGASSRARSAPARRDAPSSAGVAARDAGDYEFEDEASLMTALRELGETDPELSLRWAREGEARYSGSEAAPQRAWILVKSLVNLGRVHEARDEARVLVEKYRDTPEALDLERHLLVHPLGPRDSARH